MENVKDKRREEEQSLIFLWCLEQRSRRRIFLNSPNRELRKKGQLVCQLVPNFIQMNDKKNEK